MEYTQMFKKWFSTASPLPGVRSSINIGAGVDGVVTIYHTLVTPDGNSYTIQVVAGVGNNINLSAVLTGTDVLVTLGTDGVGALLASKNTAILISTAINLLTGVTSVYSGTGATSIGAAIAKTNFTGGQFATPVNCRSFIVISGVWYIADNPITKETLGGWKSATPA